MRGAAPALVALALVAGTIACATSSASSSESGEAVSCDASMFILDGGCVDFPAFSDAVLSADDAGRESEGGAVDGDDGSLADEHGDLPDASVVDDGG